jgi:hypothetical protein
LMRGDSSSCTEEAYWFRSKAMMEANVYRILTWP